MPIAINLRCDDETGDQVRRLWSEAEYLEEAPSMSSLGYPPHVTLAQSDVLAESDAVGALESLALPATPLELMSTGIGFFEVADYLILWCAIARSEALETLHAQLCGLLGNRIRPNYRPPLWRPHCTIAKRVPRDRREDAEVFAFSHGQELGVRFGAIDVVVHPPIRVSAERCLHDAA